MKQIVFSEKGFYLGDPWCVLNESIFKDFYQQPKLKTGIINLDTSHKNFSLFIDNTSAKDGIFKDNQKRKYLIAGGVIAAIPNEILETQDYWKYALMKCDNNSKAAADFIGGQYFDGSACEIIKEDDTFTFRITSLDISINTKN